MSPLKTKEGNMFKELFIKIAIKFIGNVNCIHHDDAAPGWSDTCDNCLLQMGTAGGSESECIALCFKYHDKTLSLPKEVM